MSNPKVVLVGHVCIDKNTTEHAEYMNWGSTVLYMARYFQEHFDINPDVITTYGKDFLPFTAGFRIHPPKPQQLITQVNENIRKKKRRIDYAHNVEYSVPPKLTEKMLSLVAQADILIVGTLLPNYAADYVRKLCVSAKPDCMKVLILQGYLRDVDEDGLVHPRSFVEAPDILPLFDLAVFSDEDHPDAIEVAKTWKANSPHTNILVTEGPKGASIIKKDASQNIPTRPLPSEDIIDSVGCGDVFSAAVAYYFYRTRELPSAIQAGHRAARVKLVSSNAD